MRRPVRSISGSALRRGLLLAGATGAAGAIVLSAVAAFAQQQQPAFRGSPYLRIDPQRIVLSGRDTRVPCGECHESEYEVWRGTPHATGFDTMHRTESAQDILEQMGLTVTKRQESLCMRCHYTVGPELNAIAGVSCESCHGPARDWIDVHNQWGEGVDHPDREPPEHEQQRIAQSVQSGMLRPSGDLYAVAANCFECHTVPLEDLVNKGGHVAGSARFELVERSAEIRHNFVQQQWGGEAANREPAPERTRLMFAVGRILAYEFALRGLAVATSEDRYFKSMERRVQQGYRELETVARAATVPAIREILGIGAELKLVPNNEAPLLAAADRIRSAGQRFAREADGATLAALDPLVAGAPAPAEVEPATPAATPPPDPAAGQARAAPAGAAPAPPAVTTGPSTPPPAAAATPTLPGRVRSRPEWFPAVDGRFRTILPGCNCHDEAEDWWAADEHEAAAARLLNKEPRAREIATLYGIDPDQMARGDRICMSCHGTAESDAPSATVLTGVSCERCHGPSSEWIDPHEEGGNPQLGMTALKNAEVRVRTCAACHRISDERLLAAGHPSGDDYEITEALRGITHYPDRRSERARQKRGEGAYPAVADAALRSAFAAEATRRAIPQVRVFSLPMPPAAPASPQPVGSATTAPSRPALAPDEVRARGEASVPSLPPRPPVTRRPSAAAPPASAPLGLEPLPVVPDTLTSEDLLLLVKRRLERLYARLGRRS